MTQAGALSQPTRRITRTQRLALHAHHRPGDAGRAPVDRPARRWPSAGRRRAGTRQNPRDQNARRRSWRRISIACNLRPICCPATLRAPMSIAPRTAVSNFSPDRFFTTWYWPMKSIARRPRCSRRCSKRWPSARSASVVTPIHCHRCSS